MSDTTIIGATPLSEIKADLIRLGIQGPPGTGKSWAAATFPNPVFLDLDGKLRSVKSVKPDALQIPFRDPDFYITYENGRFKAPSAFVPPNRRDAIKHWLRKNGPNLKHDQTLILDSWTSLHNYFDQAEDLNPPYAKAGGIDGREWWKHKLAFSIEMVEILAGLKCNVVVTCHETIERNEEGVPTGKVKPLCQGSFADQLAGHFTDFYRQVVLTKLDSKGNVQQINGKPMEEEVGYYWQVKSDAIFTACAGIPFGPNVKYIKADYKSLIIS